MKPATIVLRSLAFHARAHAATLGGVLAASAVLTGALALGDSVRASLARAAENRVGAVEAALGNGERFFGAELAARMEHALPGLVAVPAIQLPAVVASPDGSRRVNEGQLLGIDARFLALAPRPAEGAPAGEEAWIGRELARALDAVVGSELVLRVPRPSATTRELALVPVDEAIVPLRVRVGRVLADEELGAFSLEAGAGPRANLFVAREWLAERLEVAGRANRAFLRGAPRSEIERVLRASWELGDAGLAWRAVGGARELQSDQVFLAPALEEALCALDPPPLGLFGYFVNALEHAGKRVPYSTVTGIGAVDARPASDLGGWREPLAALAPGALVLNDWTADDLGAEVGDEVVLRYFVLGAGRALEERTRAFHVAAILPMEGIGADPSLAPEFPGIGDAENCRDWDPGIPIDLDAIRDEDEAYWDQWRGAPKALLSLADARAAWANRYGALTALRVHEDQAEAALAALRGVDPGVLGLVLRDVTSASSGTSDFGALFLGLSFFLVASALLLTALFTGFALERRAGELGVLRVSGFGPGEVARLQLGEALLVCGVGAALGAVAGLLYTRLLLAGLEGVWQGAVGRTELVFAITARSLVLGWGLSVGLALVAVALVLRRALRARPVALLFGELTASQGAVRGARTARGARVALAASALAALGCLAGAFANDGSAQGALAFGAGLAALVAGLLAARLLLSRAAHPRSLAELGWTNATRRAGRSLTTVALVASAIFLLVVAGASRQGPTPPDAPRASGTGGFDFVGRTNLPVLHDLTAEEGREFYGLAGDELAGTEIVPLRVRAGDDASCLNLDRPRSPRLLGVPEGQQLAGRFRFAGTLREVADPWALLAEDLGPGVVPAIVDAVSLQWTLHRALGDELELADSRGVPFRARVVATLDDSILQGDVLLSARAFERLFPDEAGHRAFLVDAPPERTEAVGVRLSRALADEGLVLVPASERLDLLHGVQNTYLAIFQALGGLGLVLGSAGLLALVLRSAIERRGELALLRALGFTRAELGWLFVGEQGGLAWLGIVVGALAGACVVLPRLDDDAWSALGPLAVLLLAVGLLACAWAWLGARPALRGSLLGALNRE